MACTCKREQVSSGGALQLQQQQIINLNVIEVKRDVFELAIPINLKKDSLTKGKYRFYFNIKALNINQIIFLLDNFGGERNTEFNVLGKKIIYLRGYADKDLNYFIAEIEILQNPIPLNAVAWGIVILLGGVLAIATLEKVEKIVEVSKPFALAVTIIALIILINLFK